MKLADFGIATVDKAYTHDKLAFASLSSSALEQHTSGRGTPLYMAPEQVSRGLQRIMKYMYGYQCMHYVHVYAEILDLHLLFP